MPIAPLRSWQLRRRILGQLPFAAVLLALVAVGCFLVLFPQHWRRGAIVVAAVMLLAAVLRWRLSRPHAGLLASRAKWIDITCFLLLAVVIGAVSIRLG
ncbi:MAG: DUF3017 domain-containing protein [Jatrophihabitans sp.]|nr:MAG: DUF3017 domain-containing protein [Jatrophihabitans sp.]